MRSVKCFILLLTSVFFIDAAGASTNTVYNNNEALAFSQAAIGRQVKDVHFASADGRSIKLSDFRGKPLIISMIYTSCYHVCPMTTRYLSSVVDKARETLGDDSFAVAVIGFDTKVDTPSAMQYFGEQQNVVGDGWHLLSISQGELESFAKDVGFLFEPTSNGFDHLVQATILNTDGQVYRQVYGQGFETPLLVDPLIELILGRDAPAQSLLTNLGNKIKLFCTTYDPVRDGYYFDYSLFIGMFIGGFIILYTSFIAVRELRKSR